MPNAPPITALARFPRRFLLALAAGLCLSLVIAHRYYEQERRQIYAEQVSTLTAVADLKLAQVAGWLAGQRDDATVVGDDPFISAAFDQLLVAPRDRGTRELLRAWANGQSETYHFLSVMLMDASGRVVLGVGENAAGISPAARETVKRSIASGEVIISDIHRIGQGGTLHLDVVAPLRSAAGVPSRGAAFFRTDPSRSLFPLLQQWPTASPSSEVNLVHREGDSVVWLNRPRLGPDGPPLSLVRPTGMPELLAVRALTGTEGVTEGVDYRGVRVLGALHRVPGTGWALVTKVDLAEIEGAAGDQAVMVGLIAGLVILLSGGAVAAAWRRRALSTLQASTQNYRALFDSAPMGVGIVRKRVVLWVNNSYLAMTGLDSVGEVWGTPLLQAIAPSRRAEVTGFALRWETGVAMPNQIETLLARRDGSEIPVLATLARVTLADGPATAVFFRDLSGQRRAEAETLRRQKLEAVTALTEGVAHDINNLLTAVIGNLSLARLLAGDPVRLPEKLAEAEEASMRIKELVNRMAAHARGEEPRSLELEVEPVLREAARETATPLRPFAPEWDMGAGLWPVPADPLRLRQALVVVMENAAEAAAASGGGPVRIAAGNLLIGEQQSTDTLPAGRYVRIAVSDHGRGIPPEALPRIFDPYFSTKRAPSDKGAGLGLHFALAVVRHHRGSITVDSRPGEGTTVTILLPAAPPAAPVEERG
jgi:PAS domain S-box-containing protein